MSMRFRALPIAIITVLLITWFSGTSYAQTCATPGKDGPGGTLNGVVNTYYPGIANANAGASSISLGAATGTATPISAGDLLLVIQMQDAALNTSNNSNYGSGTGTGTGSTSIRSGQYEFVRATNSVSLSGGTVNFIGTGSGNRLNLSYRASVSNQRRFQVVRVPQYSTATLGSGLTADHWTIDTVTGWGTGGVLVIDVAGTLTLGSASVSVNGKGFRGGGARQLSGGAGGANTDYVSSAANSYHASKGEGIAGRPRYVYDAVSGTVLDYGTDGYPSGSFARGAPANAGGGGNDGRPSNNDQNAGGGGGGNGGSGGNGGNTWSSNLAVGGIGGSLYPYLSGASNAVLGGGGGAATRNNSTGVQSSGGAGGGIVFIRAGAVTGTATISANGSDGESAANDGGGGGGAGGSIIFYVASGSLSGLNLQARGGKGGDAWPTQTPSGYPGERHGPGGGGGGGFIAQSGGASVNVSGGANGITTTASDAYGATAGTTGIVNSPVSAATIPGVIAGASCIPSVSLAKSVSPTGAQIPGTDLTYTINVINSGGAAAQNLTIADQVPAHTDFKVGSAAAALPSGLTVVIEYSSDNGSSWAYAPASGSGGAPTGYDRNVTNVRWRVSAGSLSQSAPNNSGNVAFTVIIR